MILGAVLVSERLVDPEQRLSQALLMLLIFALTQIIMRVINACTSLLQNQLLVCSRTFVTLRLNAKLLRMGQLASDEFSTGNLKTLISSDIYRISDFLHGISRNGVPCLLGVLLLGPVVVFYMGWPGVIALGLGFAALPLAMVLGPASTARKKSSKQRRTNSSLSLASGFPTCACFVSYRGATDAVACGSSYPAFGY